MTGCRTHVSWRVSQSHRHFLGSAGTPPYNFVNSEGRSLSVIHAWARSSRRISPSKHGDQAGRWFENYHGFHWHSLIPFRRTHVATYKISGFLAARWTSIASSSCNHPCSCRKSRRLVRPVHLSLNGRGPWLASGTFWKSPARFHQRSQHLWSWAASRRVSLFEAWRTTTPKGTKKGCIFSYHNDRFQ